MKTAVFHELLESVRDAGVYLKGNLKPIARSDQISSRTAKKRTKLKRR